MKAHVLGECKHRRCGEAYWKASDDASFCSANCAYAHAVEEYRRSTTAPCRAPSSMMISRSDGALSSIRFGKCHTLTLIRCGIDPWTPVAEIQMRQHFCHSLIVVLGGYSRSSNISDYAWPLENMNYCLSYLPEYAASWTAAAPTCSATSSIQRYRLLCDTLVRQIKKDVPYVRALLGGLVHPSDFYARIFGK